MVDIALQRKGIWLYIHMAIWLMVDIALQRRGIWLYIHTAIFDIALGKREFCLKGLTNFGQASRLFSGAYWFARRQKKMGFNCAY